MSNANGMKFLMKFIAKNIYIAPLQGYYSYMK